MLKRPIRSRKLAGAICYQDKIILSFVSTVSLSLSLSVVGKMRNIAFQPILQQFC